MGPSKESLSVLYKSFLLPLLTYASPGWFPFLSVTNFTKLEGLHRAASRAITGCLSSSPIQLLLSEASLPPLRVTLTHFTFLFYERALRLPTSFPISGLARLGVKPRLDGVVVRASASQSVDLGFIPLVESYQKTLKNGIYNFPAWFSEFRGGCREQAGKFASCVLGQDT